MLYRAALNFQSVLSLILGSLLLGTKGESARYAATIMAPMKASTTPIIAAQNSVE